MENHINLESSDKEKLINKVVTDLETKGYRVEEVNGSKPWGGYIRLSGSDADTFIGEYFSGLTPQEARLGVVGLELSPKILIVSPGQRLSWQYHHRRAERWVFLTPGGFHVSDTDDEGELQSVEAGYDLQIAKGQRHRLISDRHNYTVVAEIWQHVDSEDPSNENDIVRLQDDYQR